MCCACAQVEGAISILRKQRNSVMARMYSRCTGRWSRPKICDNVKSVKTQLSNGRSLL